MRWMQVIALCAMLGPTVAWAQEWESLDNPSTPVEQLWCPQCSATMRSTETRCPFGHEGVVPVSIHVDPCPLPRCGGTTVRYVVDRWVCTNCGLPLKYVRKPFGFERTTLTSRDWLMTHVRGELQHRFFWYEAEVHGAKRTQNESRLRFNYQTQIGNRSTLFLSPEVRWDDAHLEERQHVQIAEAYGEYHATNGRFTTRLGKQMFSWGRVEKAQPRDVVFPRDLQNLLSPEEIRIGVWSWWGQYDPNPMFSVQGMVIPTFTPHRLPRVSNRWSLAPFDQSIAAPDDDLHNAQGGLSFTTHLSRFDMTASYFRGPSRLPSLLPVFVASPSFTYPIEHVWGMDVGFPQLPIGTKGEITVKGEGTYTRSEGNVGDDLFRYALYADYTVEDVVRPRDQARFALQYLGATIANEGIGIEYPRFFSDAWMGALEYFPRGQTGGTTVRCIGVYNASQRSRQPILQGGDALLRVEASTTLWSRGTLTIGAQRLTGPRGSIFGDYKENSGIDCGLTIRFGGKR